MSFRTTEKQNEEILEAQLESLYDHDDDQSRGARSQVLFGS